MGHRTETPKPGSPRAISFEHEQMASLLRQVDELAKDDNFGWKSESVKNRFILRNAMQRTALDEQTTK